MHATIETSGDTGQSEGGRFPGDSDPLILLPAPTDTSPGSVTTQGHTLTTHIRVKGPDPRITGSDYDSCDPRH